ncbi:MAG: zincin-like metallopeptidase domain-containing protein, partial [Bacteroidota bacterium]
YEVSPVLHGANQLTGTISVKSDEEKGGMMMGPEVAIDLDREEMEKQLSMMLGAKVSIMDVNEEEVTFARQDQNGGVKKYKCGYSRGGRGFMFGAPERVMPQMHPTQNPVMPMAVPMNEPRRVIRPTQMPSIPVAVKPGEDGIIMVALPPVEYENEDKPIDKNDLDKEEADLRDALRKIVKRHGKLDEDGDGIWAGYYPPEKNPVAGIGVKCANCVFYKGGTSCEILALEVHPEGKCRFAVIPNGVVKGDVVAKKDYEIESEMELNEFMEDLEQKYPGELILAGFRGILSRRKKKRRKWKDLSEFDENEAVMEKGYLIPVHPSDAFYLKKELDPIIDFHGVDSFVDEDGIVLTSGITYDFIDAVDNALQNIKKKSLDNPDVNVKDIGGRIGSYAASRLIDRPRIGGGRRGRGGGRGLASGGVPGDLDPNLMSMVDFDRDGWAREGSTKPVWVGISSGDAPSAKPGQEIWDSPKARNLLRKPPTPEEITRPYINYPNKKREAEYRTLSSGGDNPFIDQATLKKDLKLFEKGEHNGRNVARHIAPDYQRFGVDEKELEARRKHEATADQWNKEGIGWMQIPWTQMDMYRNPEYLRGRELGYNQARIKWAGDGRTRPKDFNEKAKGGVAYASWYYDFVGNVGSYLKAFGENRDNEDFWQGVEDAIHDSVYVHRPDTANWPEEYRKALSDWQKSYGFDPGSRRKNRGQNSLSSGGQRIFSDDTVRSIVGGDPKRRVYFDADNEYGDENLPIDQGFDVYEKIIEDFLGPEAERPKWQEAKKPKTKPTAKPKTPDEMSDEDIYNERMAGASLEEMADKLGMTRQEVRQRELRHMRKMREQKSTGATTLSSGARKMSKGYKDFLAKKESKRTAEEISEFNGPASIFKAGQSLSSGADVKPEELESNKEKLDKMYADLTEKVLAALQEAIKNPGKAWDIPWRTSGDVYARNPTKMPQRNGRVYEGLNQLLLSYLTRSRGYEVNRWAGKAQWKKAGGTLKPDAQPVNIFAPVPIYGMNGEFIRNDYKVVTVFHVNDVLGLPEKFYKPTPKDKTLSEQERLEIAENVVKDLKPDVTHGNYGGAFYRPSTDKIYMPAFEDFKSAVQYYGTLLHEMVHWTGHPNRTGRPKGGRMNAPDGSPEKIAYAKEELVAEIGAAFVMGILGLEPQVREDHAQYLASWMRSLETEPNALRTALDRAQEAVD